MKNTFVLGLIILSGATACTATTEISSATQPECDYKKPIDFIRDFLDPSKKPDKPLVYWVKQVILLTKGDNKFKPFLAELLPACKQRNAQMIFWAFANHKEKFKDPKVESHIKGLLKEKGINGVIALLAKRVKKQNS